MYKSTERKRDTDTWLRESFKQEGEDGDVDMKEEIKTKIESTESPKVGKQCTGTCTVCP